MRTTYTIAQKQNILKIFEQFSSAANGFRYVQSNIKNIPFGTLKKWRQNKQKIMRIQGSEKMKKSIGRTGAHRKYAFEEDLILYFEDQKRLERVEEFHVLI